jgi:dihydrofolate reductase
MTVRFVLNLAVSADGFLADAQGGVDWLKDFPAEDFGFDAFYETVDVCVLGRHTYEQSLTLGDGWGEDGVPAIIVTSRPIGDLPDGVETWRGTVQGLAARLKADLLGDNTVWVVGGAKVMTGFLEAGLVDRIELFVVPVKLGSGLPPFGPSGVEALGRLRLATTETLDRGVTKLVYERAAETAAAA